MSVRPVGAWLLVGAGVLVLASIVAAIVSIGTPAEQRLRRLDERRMRDLQQLEAAIGMHHRVEGSLPASLQALTDGGAAAPAPLRDPASGEPYGYRVLDARRYEICAVFDRASPSGGGNAARTHPAGRHCLRQAVDPPAR